MEVVAESEEFNMGNRCINAESITLMKTTKATGTDVEVKEAVPRTGSFLGALFNMINGPIGAGMLAFPYTYDCTGFTAGLLVSFIVITLSSTSLLVLCQLSFFQFKDRKLQGLQSYQGCVQEHLGTFFRRCAEFVLLIRGTLILICYYVILGQFLAPVIDAISPGDNFWNDERVIIIVFSVLFIYPLLLLREIKQLGFSSFISVFSSFYLVFLIIVLGIIAIATSTVGPGVKNLMFLQTELYPGTKYPVIFIAIPTQMCGYMCHVLLFPVSYELKKGNTVKFSLIVIISMTVVSGIYVSLGLFGWFKFGTDVDDNILNNFSGKSILGNIGRATIGLNLVLSLPIQHYSARLAIRTFFWGKDKKRFGTPIYLTITTVYFFICISMALFVPGISILFGFIGSTCGVIFMFLFPGLMILKSLVKRGSVGRRCFCYLIAIVFFVTGAVIGVTGVTSALLQLLAQYHVIG